MDWAGGNCVWAISVALLLVQTEIKVNPTTHESLFDYFIKQHAGFGGVTAVLGLVLSCVYQTGSKRLGVVDLFACEISAICRVSYTLQIHQPRALHARLR